MRKSSISALAFGATIGAIAGGVLVKKLWLNKYHKQKVELANVRACLKNRKRRLFAHKQSLSASKILVNREIDLRFSP